jgi:NAD(P)-dependent dehydrogenase (short-subunit alcohol dehydrogenase family)
MTFKRERGAAHGGKHMKILVIGATGRVGNEVVKALLLHGAGAGVRALTRKQPRPGVFPDAVEVVLGDLNDPVSIAEAMKGVSGATVSCMHSSMVSPHPILVRSLWHPSVSFSADWSPRPSLRVALPAWTRSTR